MWRSSSSAACSGSSGPAARSANAPVDVFDLPTMDGTLVVVEPPKLVLSAFKPVDGQEEIEFTIRDQDKRNFDVAHLRSHSSIGLPTRIFYLEEGGKRYAVYKTDAPANSSRDAGRIVIDRSAALRARRPGPGRDADPGVRVLLGCGRRARRLVRRARARVVDGQADDHELETRAGAAQSASCWRR